MAEPVTYAATTIPVAGDSKYPDVDEKPGLETGTGIVEAYGETKRGLQPRHVQLMSIGGSIGVAIWVGVGNVLVRAGPLSLILGFLFWGFLFVWPLYLSVAEMMTYLPIRGTIFELAARYVDPALGFAMGWTYFFSGVMLLCTEYSAVATLMQYWVPDVNPAAWIGCAMFVCVLLNVMAVKWYGESEFFMASTKVFLLIFLVMITFVTMCGGNPRHDAYGFRTWKETAVMHPYLSEGSTGRFLGFWSVVLYSAFTIAGPDLIVIAAGEIANPRHVIPRVAKLIFWRIVSFYVIGVFAVGIICSSRNETLIEALSGDAVGAGSSPWVIGIQELGISGMPDFVNAMILLSAWSCGNAYLYASSRSLYGLARDHRAPQFLLRCTASGVPIYCVATVSLISCVTFLVASNAAVDVFYWFVDLTTTALIMTYSMMLITYFGWYRACKAQGFDRNSLLYRTPLVPYTPALALLLGILALIFVGFDVFSPFSVRGFITSYFGVFFGVFMYFLWKIIKRTKLVKPEEADLISGKAEVDAECRHWEDGGVEERERERLAQLSFVRRRWEKLW